MKLKIESAHALQGDLYEVWGEDCAHHCYYTSIVVEAGGKQFVSRTLGVPGHFYDEEHGLNYPNRQANEKAAKLVEKVLAKGVIDTQFWEELPEEPSLEERWSEESLREQMERQGYL
jgi:hypothetical protein